jgi:hypothetical protein
MKWYVKATKFMWYSWKNSIILEGFVHICIRKNVGVALKSKELRVCAMDVLGFLLVWFRMFWKKKKQKNKTKQNKIEKWAHEETLVVAILPWGKSIFIIGFSYKIFRKQKWYAGSSKRGKKRAKGANVCVCVCVCLFVAYITHTYGSCVVCIVYVVLFGKVSHTSFDLIIVVGWRNHNFVLWNRTSSTSTRIRVFYALDCCRSQVAS